MNRLDKAHAFAVVAHGNQERKFTGVPYLEHLEETAQLLWVATEGSASEDEYIAALLHDVVEDTEITEQEVSQEFGQLPANLVMELTINQADKERIGKKNYLVKSINAMTEEAFTIKLCDRLSNVIGLENKKIPDKFVKWYMRETEYILKNINRSMTKTQKDLVKKLNSMLVYLKLNRKL